MSNPEYAERRTKPRYDVAGLDILVHTQGRLARLRGMVLNFNQHGLAVFLYQPLPKHALVFQTLQMASRHIGEIIGVVHNCTAFSEGYRCGIQFRTDSSMQFDQDMVREALALLEARFACD